MPFYNKVNNYDELFEQYKKNQISGLILPPAERLKQIKKHLLDYGGRDALKDPERTAKLENLFEKIKQKIIDFNQANGIQKSVEECIHWQEAFSKGGSHESGKNLEYLVIYLGDIVVLEPIGQYKNATFILRNDENLASNLQRTREEVVAEQGVIKLSHEENEEYADYPFDAENIIQILDALVVDKDRFLQDAKAERFYSNIERIMKIRAVRELVGAYDITYEELRIMVREYSKGTDIPFEERDVLDGVKQILDGAEDKKLYQTLKNYIPRKNANLSSGDSREEGGDEGEIE